MRILKNINKMSFLLALEAFLSIGPYFLWETYSAFKIFDILKMLLELYILFKFLKTRNTKIKISIFCMIISFSLMYLYYILDEYGGRIQIGLGTIMKAIIIIIFLLQSSNVKKDVFDCFCKIFAISLIPSIAFSVLSILGINVGGSYIESVSVIKNLGNQHYLHFPGCVFRENIYYSPRFKQLCGMFDEPGMVGTISALILIAKKFLLKNDKTLVIVLMAGILSMSFAFYLLIVIWSILILLSNKKLRDKTICAMLIMIVIALLLRNNAILKQFIFNRLSLVNLINNNRTSTEFDTLFNVFLKSDTAWILGYGNNNPIFNNVDVSSYKLIIYNLGIIGFILYCGWFAFWGFFKANRNKMANILVICFLISIYQRPWILYLYFIVILFGGIEYLKNCDDKE